MNSLWATYNIWLMLGVFAVLGLVITYWMWRTSPRPSSARPPEVADDYEDQKEFHSRNGIRSQDHSLPVNQADIEEDLPQRPAI